MISFIGLVLTFLGGAIALFPNLPKLFKLSHRIPPFSNIFKAEEQLYREGEISKDDAGFKRLVASLMDGSQPYLRTSENGSFREFSAQFPSNEGTVEVGYEDCKILKIEKEDDAFLDNSVFSVWLIPEDRPDSAESLPNIGKGQNLLMRTEIPNGRLPELIKEYKRSLMVRAGFILLSAGFIIGVFGHFQTDIISLINLLNIT